MTAKTVEVSQLQCSDKLIDVPVVQVVALVRPVLGQGRSHARCRAVLRQGGKNIVCRVPLRIPGACAAWFF